MQENFSNVSELKMHRSNEAKNARIQTNLWCSLRTMEFDKRIAACSQDMIIDFRFNCINYREIVVRFGIMVVINVFLKHKKRSPRWIVVHR